jgi:hypothetical protein
MYAAAASRNIRRSCKQLVSSHVPLYQTQRLLLRATVWTNQNSYHRRYRYTSALTAAAIGIPLYALGTDDESCDTNATQESSSNFAFWPFPSSSSSSTSPEAQQTSARNMTSPPAPAEIAPGRPETLTKEQEAKLKELWSACLKVFGVVESESVTSSDTTTPDDRSAATNTDEASTANSGTPKKKSLGRLLGRNKKEKEVPAPSSGAATISVAVDETDDKYGHNKDFKVALASQTPAELRGAFWEMVKCDNPDGLLLRFLRARKWDVDKALVMLVATMGWRAKEMDVAGVVRSGEAGAIAEKDDGFMLQLRLGKSFLHGVDKEGRPICFVRVRLHKQADQSEKSLERYTIYIMETARLMLRSPVDTACVVFDMTNFSLANMVCCPHCIPSAPGFDGC